MIINHNIAALNTYRQLTSVNSSTGKSLEKLSSGLRINRAGDDAAGLAISEKMRGQIRGLDQAVRNAQDGISLIQTAEGALNETHSILQRMRELAVQAASDTNTTVDRAELQKEVDQLAQELARIGNTTEFNTQALLDGQFKGTFQIGANAGQNLELTVNDMRSYALGVTGKAQLSVTGSIIDGTATTDADFQDGTYTINLNGTTYQLLDTANNVVATSSDGKIYTLSGADDTLTFGEAVTQGQITITGTTASATAYLNNTGLQAGEYSVDYVSGTEAYIKDSNGNTVAKSTDAKTFISVENGATVLTLSSAITADTTVRIGGVDISSQSAADGAITTINAAIEKVSAERSKLGAYQNRLEHTINNLGTASENLTAAESRIRDVDMAKEMMQFTRNNIIAQAATAMLAQANQVPQQVLQLLR